MPLSFVTDMKHTLDLEGKARRNAEERYLEEVRKRIALEKVVESLQLERQAGVDASVDSLVVSSTSDLRSQSPLHEQAGCEDPPAKRKSGRVKQPRRPPLGMIP